MASLQQTLICCCWAPPNQVRTVRESHAPHLPSSLYWPSHLLLYRQLQPWQAMQIRLCLYSTFLVEHNVDKVAVLLALLAVH